MIGHAALGLLDRDADDLAVLLDDDGRRFAGGADDADAVGAFGDVPVDQAAQGGVVDAAVFVHRRDERDDAASDRFHAVSSESDDFSRGAPVTADNARARRTAGASRTARDALHEARAARQEAVFVGDHAQRRGRLAAARRAAAGSRGSTACRRSRCRGEGLVDQHAAGATLATMGQQRPPQVVGDDHGVEAAAGERPGPFSMSATTISAMSRQRRQRGRVAVDAGDAAAACRRTSARAGRCRRPRRARCAPAGTRCDQRWTQGEGAPGRVQVRVHCLAVGCSAFSARRSTMPGASSLMPAAELALGASSPPRAGALRCLRR